MKRVLLSRARGVSLKISPAKLEMVLKECENCISKSKKRARAKLELRLVKSTEMKALNFQFRKKNKTTDVLSFSSTQYDFLGSIVIDVVRAKTQAGDYGHSLLREVFELFVHGIFHLYGHDHQEKSDERKMKALEARIEEFLSRKIFK